MAAPVILTTRPKALAAALVVALGLAACQPQAPDGEPAPPPADAPAAAAAPTVSDFSQPMTARGTEPFWAVTIDGTRFKLSRPSQPDLIAEAPGAAIQPGQAVWVARSADGRQMTVTLRIGECSDGMSDLKYPMSAEVVLLNEALVGCAAKTAELPKEGG